MVGLKTVTYAKISPKLVNPRDIAGNAEEEEEDEEKEEEEEEEEAMSIVAQKTNIPQHSCLVVKRPPGR